MNRFLFPAAVVLAFWVSSAEANDGTVCEIQPGLVITAKRVDLQRSTTPWICSLSRIISDKSLQSLKKDEYETTKAFKGRVEKTLAAPVAGYNLSKPISLAVKADTYNVSYDADTERLTVKGKGEGILNNLAFLHHYKEEPETNLALSVNYVLENGMSYDENYVAQHPKITSMKFQTKAAVVITAPRTVKVINDYSQQKSLLAKLPPEQAKAVKENLYVLISGTVSTTKPYGETGDEDGMSMIEPGIVEEAKAIYFEPGANYAVVRGDTGEILASGPLK